MPDWLVFVAPLVAASLVLLLAFAGCGFTKGIPPGPEDLMFYEPPTGQGEFWSTDGQGGIALIGETHTDWRTTWRLIVPGYFQKGAGTDLLFYDRDAGEGEFWSVSGGGISLIGETNTGWRNDWTLIIPGNFTEGDYTDLLFYERSTGQGEFWRSNGDGTISLIGETNFGWRTSWQMIVPGNFSDGPFTDLLFYDRAAGQGEFWKTNGNGSISMIGETHTDWRQSWQIILPGFFLEGSDYTDLLFYDRGAGHGEFWRTDGNGGISMPGETNTDWRTSWAQIVPANFGDQGEYTDLLFYEARTGTGEFWASTGSGGVEQIGASHTDWRNDWFIIRAGYFD
jgi:hypothetical protein